MSSSTCSTTDHDGKLSSSLVDVMEGSVGALESVVDGRERSQRHVSWYNDGEEDTLYYSTAPSSTSYRADVESSVPFDVLHNTNESEEMGDVTEISYGDDDVDAIQPDSSSGSNSTGSCGNNSENGSHSTDNGDLPQVGGDAAITAVSELGRPQQEGLETGPQSPSGCEADNIDDDSSEDEDVLLRTIGWGILAKAGTDASIRLINKMISGNGTTDIIDEDDAVMAPAYYSNWSSGGGAGGQSGVCASSSTHLGVVQ